MSQTADKEEAYRQALASIASLLDGESDWIAAMATVACELHHRLPHFDWTGFYRASEPSTLVIGPYQGGHGCLRIDFARGVCGKAARERTTVLVPDVRAFEDHIACSSTTLSEIVVPVVDRKGRLLAVLDVDSDELNAFDETDRKALESLCALLGERFSAVA